jgi:hypothetical protein
VISYVNGFCNASTAPGLVNKVVTYFCSGYQSCTLWIDRAMKFGVNYPKGAFEWVKGREKFVLALLEELRLKTGDERDRACSLLKI